MLVPQTCKQKTLSTLSATWITNIRPTFSTKYDGDAVRWLPYDAPATETPQVGATEDWV